MKSIDEAIELLKNCEYLTNREEKQIAEWLEELKEIKSNGRYVQGNKAGQKIGYRNAIDDFADKIIRYVDCGHLCSPTEMRWSDLTVVEMVKKLAEQLKAGRSDE